MVIPFGANLPKGTGQHRDDDDKEGEELKDFSFKQTLASLKPSKKESKDAKKRYVSQPEGEEQEHIKTLQPKTSQASLWSRGRQRERATSSAGRYAPGQSSNVHAEPVPPIPNAYLPDIDTAPQSLQIPDGRDSPAFGQPGPSNRLSAIFSRRRSRSSSLDWVDFLDEPLSDPSSHSRSRSISGRTSKPLIGNKEYSGVEQNLDSSFASSTFSGKTKSSSKKDNKPDVKSKLRSVFTPGFLKSKTASNETETEPAAPSKPFNKRNTQPDPKGKGKEKAGFAPSFPNSPDTSFTEQKPEVPRPLPVRSTSKYAAHDGYEKEAQPAYKGKGKEKAAFAPGFLTSSNNSFHEQKPEPVRPLPVRSTSKDPSLAFQTETKPTYKGKGKEKAAFSPGFLTSSNNPFHEQKPESVRSPSKDLLHEKEAKPANKGKGKQAFAPGFLTSSKNIFNEKEPTHGSSSKNLPKKEAKPADKGKGKAVALAPGFLTKTNNPFNGKARKGKFDSKGKREQKTKAPEYLDFPLDHLELASRPLVFRPWAFRPSAFRPTFVRAAAPAVNQQADTRTVRQKAIDAINGPKLAPIQVPVAVEARPATASGDYSRSTRGHSGGHTVAALINDVATKRITTLDYLKKAHDGRTYWFNTLFFGLEDLKRLPWFEPKKLAKRTQAFYYLGESICNHVDTEKLDLPEFLAALNGVMADFEQYSADNGLDIPSGSSMSRRVPDLFKRVTSGPQGRNRRTSDMGAAGGPGGAEYGTPNSPYKWLIMAHYPFDMDYVQIFKTLMDAFIEVYTALLQMVDDSANIHHLQVPANIEAWTKADNRIKKALIFGLARDFEQLALAGMRSEIAGVARLAMGGLAS